MPRGPSRKSAAQRFSAKIRKTSGCWLWTGSVNNHGYGRFWTGEKVVLAHHFAWHLSKNVYPSLLLHICDTPNCVRVEHLRVGTQSDNLRDMYSKDRHPKSRIGPSEVMRIRDRLARGEQGKRIARDYGVSPSSIYHIKNGRTWSWYTGEATARRTSV